MSKVTRTIKFRIAIGGVLMFVALLFWILGHDNLVHYVGVTR